MFLVAWNEMSTLDATANIDILYKALIELVFVDWINLFRRVGSTHVITQVQESL